MAIVDLSTVSSFPYIKSIASVGTTQQEITLPQGKIRLSIGGDVETQIATSSVSDGAAMPSDTIVIPASNLLEINLGHSTLDRISNIAVAASTGSANVQLILERI
jgi:hypothetical protein